MTDLDWAMQEAGKRAAAATAVDDQAFYLELQAFFAELAQRQDLAEAELDGRAWDHRRW